MELCNFEVLFADKLWRAQKLHGNSLAHAPSLARLAQNKGTSGLLRGMGSRVARASVRVLRFTPKVVRLGPKVVRAVSRRSAFWGS